MPGGEDEKRCRGFTLHEAVERAVDVGSPGAWEWLQAWWKDYLEGNDPPPEAW